MEENKPEEHAGPEPVESPTIGKLIMALAKAQGMILPAPKDTANTFFKSKYADLASVWEACREPLSKNGIAVIQRPNPTDGTTISLTTILAHESGEWIKGTLIMRPVEKCIKDPDNKVRLVVDPQSAGSCLTYARRYALSAMVGICSEEDDDGNKASQKKASESEQEPDGDHWVISKVKAIVPTSNPKFVTIHTIEDKKLGTGDEALIAIAAEVLKTGEEVRFHFVTNGRFSDLTDIERRAAAPAPAERSGPVAAKKQDPNQMAPMSPSAGHKIATGLISEQLPTNASGYTGWLIENQQNGDGSDMKFVSKDPVIYAMMAEAIESKRKLHVEYKPTTKSGMANIIFGVRPAALEKLGF